MPWLVVHQVEEVMRLRLSERGHINLFLASGGTSALEIFPVSFLAEPQPINPNLRLGASFNADTPKNDLGSLFLASSSTLFGVLSFFRVEKQC